MQMERVYDYLLNFIKLNSLDKVVVGVSAVPDSMALLYILEDLRKKIDFKIIQQRELRGLLLLLQREQLPLQRELLPFLP